MPAASSLPTPQTTEAGPADSTKPKAADPMPTIRFIPHTETRSSRPSLQFTAISRTLATPASVVRVGRYSERDNPTVPSSTSTTPVGFKSKVVSRRHCEFWYSKGQWYVKDVKSSSGTFLNHVRMSPPGHESKPYAVNDGDVVQLGIDFKGGEEIIFRCVKIRVECNRGWQKSLNNFNTSAHKKLFKSNSAGADTKTRQSDAASVNTNECSICLNPVAPCQALFVAPCSHVWHWKCIRKIVNGPSFPHFVCPNCRFVADLEADVEPPEDYADYWPEKGLDEDHGEAAAQPETAAMEDASDEENESNDGVARLTPSQEDGDEEHDQQHDTVMDDVNVDERPPTPPTSLPAAQAPNRPNPFENMSPNPPSVDPYRPHTLPPGFSESTAARSRSATTEPRPIPSTGRRVSAPWRNESSEDLSGQARSPTPTNSTAFALTADIEGMERLNPPGAMDHKGE